MEERCSLKFRPLYPLRGKVWVSPPHKPPSSSKLMIWMLGKRKCSGVAVLLAMQVESHSIGYF
jgi:hypothetical protein